MHLAMQYSLKNKWSAYANFPGVNSHGSYDAWGTKSLFLKIIVLFNNQP